MYQPSITPDLIREGPIFLHGVHTARPWRKKSATVSETGLITSQCAAAPKLHNHIEVGVRHAG